MDASGASAAALPLSDCAGSGMLAWEVSAVSVLALLVWLSLRLWG